MATRLDGTSRQIGRWGTAARIVGGAAMLTGAALIGVEMLDALLGLVVFPLAVLAVLRLRGADAAPLRLTGSEGYCLNCLVGVAAFVFLPAAALLFVGASTLVAAARGDAGCEVFAVSNWLRRRDDRIACPVFSPIDAAERRAREVMP
jgi:hypothetical protein